MATFGQIPSDINFSKMNIVADIAARDALTGLTHGDRVMVTGIGQFGVEFFYDGAAWRPQDGQVLCRKLLTATAAEFDTNADIGVDALPQDFAWLEIRGEFRTDKATEDGLSIQLNGDTLGGNYQQGLEAIDNVTQTNTAGTGTSVGQIPGTNVNADVFNHVWLELPGYNKGTHFKAILGRGGGESSSAGSNSRQDRVQIAWQNVAAITRIRLVPDIGPNFVAESWYAVIGHGFL